MDKKTYKDLADAIGMPDAKDKENIQNIILAYEKKHPGYILHARNMARESLADTTYATTDGSRALSGRISSGSAMRLHLELPEELYHNIEAYIPTIFREKKHYHWFLKNFPELLIPNKF